MSRLVLRGARWPGDVAHRDGRSTRSGPSRAAEGDEVFECDGAIITAGLVNTHHHLYQWMTRGRATGCDLFGWLTTLYPVWGRLEVEDVHAAARVGIAELVLSGCTTVFDHHYLVPRGDDTVFDAIVDAAGEVGVRLFLSRGSMDLSREARRAAARPRGRRPRRDPRVHRAGHRPPARRRDGAVVVAPCSPFTVTPELMQASAEARRHGLRMHTHLAETLEEQADSLARFGPRPTECSTAWGWIAPDVWFAHGVHFDDGEVARSAPPAPASPTARRRTRASPPACAASPTSWPPGSAGRARRRRRGVERSRAPLRRDAPVAVHGPPARPGGPTPLCRPTRSPLATTAGRLASAATISGR